MEYQIILSSRKQPGNIIYRCQSRWLYDAFGTSGLTPKDTDNDGVARLFRFG
jgi:hypothetical protein